MVAIEHVGSTAVPGLASKPVLDVDIAIRDLAAWAELVAPLRALGYEHQPAGDFEDRRFFRRFERGVRRAHVSLTELGSAYWCDHLRFRDALRADPRLAARYGDLKRRLAREVGHDRAAYTDGKDGFVREVLAATIERAVRYG